MENSSVINAEKAKQIANDAIKAKKNKIEKQAQEALKVIQELIKQEAEKGLFNCTMHSMKGTWPDTIPKFGFDFSAQDGQTTEHGTHIMNVLRKSGFKASIYKGSITVSWD